MRFGSGPQGCERGGERGGEGAKEGDDLHLDVLLQLHLGNSISLHHDTRPQSVEMWHHHGTTSKSTMQLPSDNDASTSFIWC